MSANNQLVTASLAGTYFCWVETAEECCGDEDGIRRLSIYDKDCYRAKSAQEAIRQATNVYGPTEYGEYRAINGKTYLADGTPVIITEIYKLHKEQEKREKKRQQKPTCAKTEQVDQEARIAELERKVKFLSSKALTQHQINQGLLKAAEELAATCETLHTWLTLYNYSNTKEDKLRNIKQFFNEALDKTKQK